MGDLLTIAQAAKRLNMTPQGVYDLIKRHNIPTQIRRQMIKKWQKIQMVDIGDLQKVREKR